MRTLKDLLAVFAHFMLSRLRGGRFVFTHMLVCISPGPFHTISLFKGQEFQSMLATVSDGPPPPCE